MSEVYEVKVSVKDIEPYNTLLQGFIGVLKEIEEKDYYDIEGNHIRNSEAYKNAGEIINQLVGGKNQDEAN